MDGAAGDPKTPKPPEENAWCGGDETTGAGWVTKSDREIRSSAGDTGYPHAQARTPPASNEGPAPVPGAADDGTGDEGSFRVGVATAAAAAAASAAPLKEYDQEIVDENRADKKKKKKKKKL